MTRASKSRTGGAVRWTEAEAAEHQARLKEGGESESNVTAPSLAEALKAMGLGERVRPRAERGPKKVDGGGSEYMPVDGGKKRRSKKKNETTTSEDTASQEVAVPVAKKPRQGVDTRPIFRSLNSTPAHSAWGKDWLAIEFPGGRILTYNEIFSILQFRKHESFSYKKICRKVVGRALMASASHTIPRPFFDGPTRWTVVRIGAKDMDRDAISIVFKYFLDALKTQGVIADDNPNIIVDIQTIQDVGPPRLAMMLERVPDWKKVSAPSWEDWVDKRKDIIPQKSKK